MAPNDINLTNWPVEAFRCTRPKLSTVDPSDRSSGAIAMILYLGCHAIVIRELLQSIFNKVSPENESHYEAIHKINITIE